MAGSKGPLSAGDVESFLRDGFVRVDDAFPRQLADAARTILWRDTGCDPDRPETWTRPVVRLGQYGQEPFREAANSPVLLAAFDQLVGPGQWLPCQALGTFPVRFPSDEDPGDTGWHVDMSFGTDSPDFMEWRINIHSKGRALLMLFLFSDVGKENAPTRIRVGSHQHIARQLQPAGEGGLTLGELAKDGFASTAGLSEVLATGKAGTVYICHPFLVHAASVHRGITPRFMAQPPLLPRGGLVANSPVERAIRMAAG